MTAIKEGIDYEKLYTDEMNSDDSIRYGDLTQGEENMYQTGVNDGITYEQQKHREESSNMFDHLELLTREGVIFHNAQFSKHPTGISVQINSERITDREISIRFKYD